MSEKNDNSEYLEYEYGGQRDDWELWDVESLVEASSEPEVSVDELIETLAQEESLPQDAPIEALSDLSRPDAEAVEGQWTQIPLQTRRAIVEELVQRAEINVHLHLGRILRVALEDSDAGIRRLAVEGLWDDEEADLIGAFTHMLRTDPSHDVRAAAANALGAFVLAGELDELDASLAMRAEESLLSVLRNEEEPLLVQCQALESIAYSGEIGVRDLIEDAYYSPFEELRISALNAMGRSADIRWRGLARAELENPSAAMRVSAAIACGELEARAAVDDLIALLNDEEEAVRLAAIFALGRLGGKAAQDALRDVSASEAGLEAEAAEEALSEMLFFGSADDIPLFDESLEMDEESDDEPWDGWYGRDDSDLGSYG